MKMPKLGVESTAVQDTLIKYAREIDWKYVKPEKALTLRSGKKGLIFRVTCPPRTGPVIVLGRGWKRGIRRIYLTRQSIHIQS